MIKPLIVPNLHPSHQARQLESLVRLAEARARCELRQVSEGAVAQTLL